MRDGYGFGEIGVDDDAVQIADDEEGRAGEGVAIEEELVVGVFQILVLAFVFPAKEILFPDIGEAIAAAVLFRAFFKAEGFARGIGLGGRGMAQHAAQVEEMLLRGGAFLELDFSPLGDEFGGVQRVSPYRLGASIAKMGEESRISFWRAFASGNRGGKSNSENFPRSEK